MMQLDITQYHDLLKMRTEGDERFVFDPVRKKYVIVQPEELVRQSWIQFLISEKRYDASSLAVEKQLQLSQGPRRFDLVIYRKGQPKMLFEFKSFKVPLRDEACRQVSSYNFDLKVPYVLLSNGIEHRIFRTDFKHRNIRELYEWPELDE